MKKIYSPKVKFANSGSTAGKSFQFIQTVEQTRMEPSDKGTLRKHFAGVIRYARDFRKYLISNLFGPSIDACTPDYSPTATAYVHFVTGTNFQDSSVLYVNGIPVATSFINDRLFSFVPPISPDYAVVDGPATLRYVRSDGKFAESTSIFRYEDPPVLSSVVPSTDYTFPAEPFITINGENLKDGSTVYFTQNFGSNLSFVAPNFSWLSSNQILVDAPEVPSSGSYTISIVSPGGQTTIVPLAFTYTYRSAVLNSITEPANLTASSAGGETLIVSGDYFVSGAVISVGTASLSTTYIDRYTLSAYTPADGSSLLAVAVTNPSAAASNTYNIQYVPDLPTILSMSANTGTDGTTIIFSGAFYSTVTAVRFWKTTASFITGTFVSNPPYLTATATSSLSHVKYSVSNYNVSLSSSVGESTRLNSWRHIKAPFISFVSPSTGSILGSSVTVNGINFLNDGEMFVYVDGVRNNFSYSGDTVFYMDMPPHAPGVTTVSASSLNITTTGTKSYNYTSSSGDPVAGWSPNIS
jgi:hypothetical protein